MDDSWTVNRQDEIERLQGVWDALGAGDPGPAIESQADGVVFDNGPGAGPWRHTEGQPAFLEMFAAFLPVFGESFHQTGTCIFANEQFAITLVAETGEHASSGDVFDNRAIYVTRFDADGKTDHVWTVDLDSEDMERFWQRNPVEST
ncbi:MAG TPA: nuclear transport factor 2 family protein [Acidimicrobiia bacterium]|jgi:hypothetical protein